jgi:acyl-CoA synthetase (AMP-forming)/AMP-acid ligase II
VDSFEPLTRIAGLSARDTILITGPLTATMHLFAAVHTLAMGAHLTDRADQATAVHAVPQRLAALLAALPPTAPLRTAVVAGAALPDSLARRCLDRGLAVTEYYGAAELSFVAARRVPEPMRAFPGVDIRIGGDGVLWARSAYLALGYAGHQPGPLRRDRDGFATVGDLASVGTGGDLTIRGRGDSAITTGGHTVLPEDVEAVLGALPGVGGVAVVGIAHPRFGQIVVAVLEPARGLKPFPDPPLATDSQPSTGRPAPGQPPFGQPSFGQRPVAGAAARPADGVIADLARVPGAARTLLAGPSRPRRYLVCDLLPRTPGGKISRAVVAAGLADGSLPTRPLR